MAGEGGGVAPVETFQSDWELQLLLRVVADLEPKWILEVGSMYGGTLWHWLQLASVGVVAVDDQMRNGDQWREWAKGCGVELHLLKGLSSEEWVVSAARDHSPYDLVLIDADHRYESVRADWENYGPLGKVIVFHDILARPGYGVSVLWADLRSRPDTRFMEICQNETLPGNEGPAGIGVLWQP